jgi:hypothetical protein
MICYKDTTYCGSTTHKPDCDRILSPEDEATAIALDMPIAYGNFCGDKSSPALWIREEINSKVSSTVKETT